MGLSAATGPAPLHVTDRGDPRRRGDLPDVGVLAGARDQSSADLLLAPQGFVADALQPAAGTSFCEWKGTARYLDVHGGGRTAPAAAWYYPNPSARFAELADHVALYAAAMDACYVAGELVIAQPGSFYGGWITASVVGPFKGVPGSQGW